MTSYFVKIKACFVDGHERTVKARRNILLSLLIRGGNIVVGLALIPMVINYVNPIEYGIWLTISSIVNWLYFFDLGMGNGLQNKLALSLAIGKIESTSKYISTTYAFLTLISIFIFVVFYWLSPLANWNKLLNVPATVHYDIAPAILIVVSAFCVQFVIQTINTILMATHQPYKVSIISFIGQLSILIAVFILTKYVAGNLMVLVSVLTFIPLLILLLSNVYLFRTELKEFQPKYASIDFREAKSLFGLGAIFFFIQLGALVLFQTNNIVITRILGPEAVTVFNVSYKLFSIFILIFTIVITPYWSAFTEAYAKNDFDWMRKNIRDLRKIWMILSVAALALSMFSEYVYRIWVGDAVKIPSSLSVVMGFYVSAFIWQTLHVYFLNGIAKIKLQLIIVTSCAVMNIPLAIFLGKQFGLVGVAAANTLLFTAMGVLFFIQCEKIMAQKARGIWNK